MEYIDIHSHLIFDVDDGSKTLKQSLKYLKQIQKIGLSKVVCTPHFKYGSISKIKQTKQNFTILKEYASKLGIDLYIGNEIMYSDLMMNLLNKKRLIGINCTNYILVEFKRNESRNINDIIEILDEMVEQGYKPILAHPELYMNYQNLEYIRKIKETGVMLQMDATSLFDKKHKKFARKLLHERLIDVVASDSHCSKKRNYFVFKKSYKRIKRKYGKEYANIIFFENPKQIINSKLVK